MRALVYEEGCEGHRLKWCATVATALADLGLEVVLAVSESAPGHVLFEDWVKPLAGRVSVEPTIPPHRFDVRGRLRQFAILREHVLRIDPDRVYFPMFDGIAQILGIARILGAWPPNERLVVEGLLMGSRLLEPAAGLRSRVSRELSFALAKSSGAESLFHLNPAVRKLDLSRGRSPESAVGTLPELILRRPRLSTEVARQRLDLPRRGRWAGMVGRLDARKGADIALRSFVQAAKPDDYLLLAGPLDKQMSAAVREARASPARERIFILDRVLPENEFQCCLDALDLAFLPYRLTAQSSGIILEAALARIPILTTGGGFAGQIFEHTKLGWLLPSLETDAVASALRRAFDDCMSWTSDETTTAFLSYHSSENFAAHWGRGARGALGMAEDDAYVPWVSVSTDA